MLIKSILICALIIPSQVLANPTNCEVQLNACDEALQKAVKVIEEHKAIYEIDQLLLNAQKEQNRQLIEQVNKQKRELDSFYRDPLLMISLGLVTGLLIRK